MNYVTSLATSYRFKHLIKGWRRNPLLLLLVPLLVYLLFFFVYPLFYQVYISFFDYSLGGRATFIGGKNYLYLFTKDIQFFPALYNTLIFIALSTLIQAVLGLAIALTLNRETKLMAMLRTVVLLPTALTPMAVGMAWKILYNPDLGGIPYYLSKILGSSVPIAPTLNPSTALLSLIVVEVWQWTPLACLLFLSGLKGIPHECYEAAQIDGASYWQSIRHITLPLLRPVLLLTILFRLLGGMKAFDIIWGITGGGPGMATTVLNLRVYDVGVQQLQIGYAAAISNIIAVIGMIVGGLYVYLTYKRMREVAHGVY